MIRSAYPRNYLLWRHGVTRNAGHVRLIVLPLVFGQLSSAEINIFLAAELFLAEGRACNGKPALTEQQSGALDRLAQSVSARDAMAVLDLWHVYRKAEREIERTVVRV